jgi:hypothetical protein
MVFSEIARLAGVAYTYWSWSALFGDCDNDGYKDLFITNGYPKAVTDYDYQTAMFRLHRPPGQDVTPQSLQILNALPGYEVSNYMFRNNGDLTFSNATRDWGLDQPGFSYGAVLADLNGDGTLDLVVNNIDVPASIYQNVRPAGDAPSRHYLEIELRGEPPNTRGIGATLTLVASGQHQYLYHTPVHGYQSSVEGRAHFGLGAATRVDSLIIEWPDGRSQSLTDLSVDRVVIVHQREAGARHPAPDTDTAVQPLDPGRNPATSTTRRRSLISRCNHCCRTSSRLRPAAGRGDVNGDGRRTVLGAAGVPGTLLMQQADGRFVESVRGQPWKADQRHVDWGALFFDANADGRLDLYVASGGYHLAPVSALLQDRLYVNRGGGRFVRDTSALPSMLTATSAVVAGDFTGDGKPDLFVGGRLVPRNYPYPTRSYLLRNDGGRFTDVTEQLAPELVTPGGMITAAVWIDFDGDGRLDLVTAGEWMPLSSSGTRPPLPQRHGVHGSRCDARLVVSPCRGRLQPRRPPRSRGRQSRPESRLHDIGAASVRRLRGRFHGQSRHRHRAHPGQRGNGLPHLRPGEPGSQHLHRRLEVSDLRVVCRRVHPGGAGRVPGGAGTALPDRYLRQHVPGEQRPRHVHGRAAAHCGAALTDQRDRSV